MHNTNRTATTVVFDFGGVLVDWNPRHLYRNLFDSRDKIERFLDEIGFDAWNLELDRGLPLGEGVARMARRFPHYRAQIEAYQHRWEETLNGSIPDSVTVLAELKAHGHPLLGLSNWSAETFARIRHQFPFFAWFDDIVLSGVVKAVKPEPDIYHILLDRNRRSAGECLFIDDSIANVRAARTLGFDAVHFESPAALRDALVARGLLAP